MKDWKLNNKPDKMSVKVYLAVMAHQLWLQDCDHVFARRLYFEDKTIISEDFSGFDLSTAVFKDCDLTGCKFSNITLNESLFVNCELESTQFDGEIVNTLFTMCDFDENTFFEGVDMSLNYMLMNSNLIHSNGRIIIPPSQAG